MNKIKNPFIYSSGCFCSHLKCMSPFSLTSRAQANREAPDTRSRPPSWKRDGLSLSFYWDVRMKCCWSDEESLFSPFLSTQRWWTSDHRHRPGANISFCSVCCSLYTDVGWCAFPHFELIGTDLPPPASGLDPVLSIVENQKPGTETVYLRLLWIASFVSQKWIDLKDLDLFAQHNLKVCCEIYFVLGKGWGGMILIYYLNMIYLFMSILLFINIICIW